MNKYCVYLHVDSAGMIRYIGSGTKTRPFYNYNRSEDWNMLFANNRPTVIIVEDNMSKEDSISLENYMYHSCKGTILNKTEPRPVKEMDYELFNTRFCIDPLSPSGLKLKNKHHCSRKNNGDYVGSVLSSNGKSYWKIVVNNKRYLVHRVIHLLTYGSIDKDLVINHIDGNGLNNNITNLEVVTQKVNCFKKKIRKDNTLGISGITEVFYKGSFDAYMAKYSDVLGNKISQRFSLAVFKTKELALSTAIDWRAYFLDKQQTEKYSGDVELLRERVKNSLTIVNYLRSESTAYVSHNGKFYSRLRIPGKGNKYCGTFDTAEEATIAKNKMIQDYNASIRIDI